MKAALLQLNVSDQPQDNLPTTLDLIGQAVRDGAGFVLTPEVTNCVSQNREHQKQVLQHEADDIPLTAMRAAAQEHGIWLSVGSLAIKTNDADGRFANRSFLIAPDGTIRGRYDKIHMFDVTVSPTETYRESAGYRPGDTATLVDAGFAQIGMSVCYDIRFAYLYRALAQAGAQVLLIPSAFSPLTGAAHWEPLLRARAIETGSYVLAAAQTGTHQASVGKPRKTYGHAMAISPWGEVLVDMGTDVGVATLDISVEAVDESRKRIAALTHDRAFKGP